MHNYVSLIMDIEKSKRYAVAERIEIQEMMSASLEQLNLLFRKNLERTVMFSAGDELQGLFRDVTSAFMYFRLFELLLRPVKVRGGIGVGEWTIKVDNALSTQQDGPAYHNARLAIDTAHKMQLHNIRICSGGEDHQANYLMNASNVLKTQQIYMQNMVQVLLECLYPFVKADQKEVDTETIKALLYTKSGYELGKRSSGKGSSGEPDSGGVFKDLSSFPKLHPILIEENVFDAEERILIKNTTLTLSGILGSSRQNVDSIIKRGNANKIREQDFVALSYLENAYGGEGWSG